MFWTVFVAAFLGTFAASIILLGGLVAYDEWVRKRKSLLRANSDDILEAHMQRYLVKDFARHFPAGWRIYNDGTKPDKLTGVQYEVRNHRGRIDILALDENDHFVIIEIKKGRAPDKVVAQVDRYITAVQKQLATRNQTVRAIIIANEYTVHFRDIIKQRSNIEFWKLDWQPRLIKRPQPIDA